MTSCNNTCGSSQSTGSGFLIVLVIYILLAIILGSRYSCCSI